MARDQASDCAFATDSTQIFHPENQKPSIVKAARNSPIPPHELRSARLLGQGHVPTCHSVEFSSLVCFASLI